VAFKHNILDFRKTFLASVKAGFGVNFILAAYRAMIDIFLLIFTELLGVWTGRPMRTPYPDDLDRVAIVEHHGHAHRLGVERHGVSGLGVLPQNFNSASSAGCHFSLLSTVKKK
jgi:hypothetical protein